MDQNNVQQEIAIVKQMIEKSRRETAESGNLFIVLGLLCSMFPWAFAMLTKDNSKLIMPCIIVFISICVIVGVIISAREEKKEKVKTYAKAIHEQLWVVCGTACIMVSFFSPMFDALPYSAVPIFVSLLLGIMVFQTGIIYELKSISGFGLLWWGGAVIMAIEPKGTLLVLTVLFLGGWVLPGLILKKNYSDRGI